MKTTFRPPVRALFSKKRDLLSVKDALYRNDGLTYRRKQQGLV